MNGIPILFDFMNEHWNIIKLTGIVTYVIIIIIKYWYFIVSYKITILQLYNR